jgi:hypothetical protein
VRFGILSMGAASVLAKKRHPQPFLSEHFLLSGIHSTGVTPIALKIPASGQKTRSPVAVEKLFRTKNAKTKLRQDAL